MSLNLLPHNEEAYQKLVNAYEHDNKAAIIHPTGTGKSSIAIKYIQEKPSLKVLYLAPTNIILHQIKNNILNVFGQDMKNFRNLKRMTYTKLMRLFSEGQLNKEYDFIVLDEFHHVGAEKWEQAVRSLIEKNQGAKVLGLSATNVRYLDDQRDMSELFGKNIVSEMSLEEAMVKGILPKPIYVRGQYDLKNDLLILEERIESCKDEGQINLARKTLEEYKKRFQQSETPVSDILNKHITNKEGKYIVFCTNIEDLKTKMEESKQWFTGINEQVEYYEIHSDENLRQNVQTIEVFENSNSKSLKVLFSVNMLNEGIHIKDIEGIIMARPTQSPTIFYQQLGRALAVGSGKQPIIFDLVDNVGSIDEITQFYAKYNELRKEKSIGKGQIENDEKLSDFKIYDEQKEFREIVSVIMDLTNKYYTIEEKIEILKVCVENGINLKDQTTPNMIQRISGIFQRNPLISMGI